MCHIHGNQRLIWNCYTFSLKVSFRSVAGLMSHKNDFFFEMYEITFNSDSLIQFMERFVNLSVKKTVVILDNCPIHKFKKFKSKIEEWTENDVLIYFLLPYSMELNLIEIFWRRINYQWLSFDLYPGFSESQRTMVVCVE
jgi:transposase